MNNPTSHPESGPEYLANLRHAIGCETCPAPFACYILKMRSVPPAPDAEQLEYLVRHDPSFLQIVMHMVGDKPSEC